MNKTDTQHKATIRVGGRQIDIHAPPFASSKMLDRWLAETLRNPNVELVSKTWSTEGSCAPAVGPAGDRGQVGWMGGEFDR